MDGPVRFGCDGEIVPATATVRIAIDIAAGAGRTGRVVFSSGAGKLRNRGESLHGSVRLARVNSYEGWHPHRVWSAHRPECDGGSARHDRIRTGAGARGAWGSGLHRAAKGPVRYIRSAPTTTYAATEYEY